VPTPQPSALLAGRRVVVTGAARGLGLAFAQAICAHGGRVVMADLRAEQLNATSGRGPIVNLASDTALWGAPRLLAIAPGLVQVEATKYVPEARHRQYVEQRALSREQLPEDVTGAVLYALSDLSRFVTGQLFAVNGGFVMH
jgi:NAD(P)-dependent dehydrogenase (short-subunit alcohol dehydrogenase family)